MSNPPPTSDPRPVMALDYYENRGPFRTSVLRSLAWVEICYAAIGIALDVAQLFYSFGTKTYDSFYGSRAAVFGMVTSGMVLYALQAIGGILLLRGVLSGKRLLKVWGRGAVGLLYINLFMTFRMLPTQFRGAPGYAFEYYMISTLSSYAHAFILPILTLLLLRRDPAA